MKKRYRNGVAAYHVERRLGEGVVVAREAEREGVVSGESHEGRGRRSRGRGHRLAGHGRRGRKGF